MRFYVISTNVISNFVESKLEKRSRIKESENNDGKFSLTYQQPEELDYGEYQS
jgi:hypothetical protein